MRIKCAVVLTCLILVAPQIGAADSSGQPRPREDKADRLVEIYLDAGSKALSSGFKEDGEKLLATALEISVKHQLESLTVTRVLDNLGKLEETAGRSKDAEGYYKRSVAMTEKIMGADSPAALKSREDLVAFYHRTRQYAEMEVVLRGSLKRVWIEAPASAEPVRQARVVMPLLQQLAEAFRLQKKYQDAEATYLNLLHQVKELEGTGTPLMVLALNNLADLYREQERNADAEKYLEASLAIMDKVFSPEHPSRPALLRGLADLKQTLGKTAEAEELHLRALSLAGTSGTSEQKALANLAVGSFYHNLFNDAKAETYYCAAVTGLDQAGGESRNLAMALVAYAECELSLGKSDAATGHLDRSRAIIERLEGKEHEDLAQVLRAKGKCLLAQGKPVEAETLLIQAKAMSVKLAGAEDLTVGYSLELLGNAYTAQGKLPEAEKCFQQAMAIEEKFTKLAPLRLAENLEAYARLLQKMDRAEDAGKQAKRASELRAQRKAP